MLPTAGGPCRARAAGARGERRIHDTTDARPPVFTIGHSNHPPDRFAGLLLAHGIEVLADTRSHPYSRHAPHFDGPAMRAALTRVGVRYLYLGAELGGRPEGEEFYDAEGRVDYALVERSVAFLGGIRRLEAEARGRRRVALLCSEEDPAGCHRRLLVGRTLEDLGFTVLHIRGDGGVQTEVEVAGGQAPLFPETEVSPRKSIRSVSRRRRPPSSSGR